MRPVAYYSSTFTPTERNYDVYERELLAVVKSLKNWRPHLAATDRPITILTDHANLLYWKNPKNVNRRVARWLTTLQDYNFVIKHVPGKIHAAADMLSRLLGSGGPGPPSSVLRSPSCRCPSTSSLLVRGCRCVYPSQGDVGIGPPSQSSSV